MSDAASVIFSYSADGAGWGLRNVYTYDWDLDNPSVHMFETARRVPAGSTIDASAPFTELLQIGGRKFSALACRDEAEKPAGAKYFCVRLVAGETACEITGEIPTMGTVARYKGPISRISWDRLGLDSVETTHSYKPPADDF